ncbi:MAG TPA: hypothetical protein VF469_03660 [Kofleriaceae bacterium]
MQSPPPTTTDTPSDGPGTTGPAPNPPAAPPTTQAEPPDETTPPPTTTPPPPTTTQPTTPPPPGPTRQTTTTTTTTSTYGPSSAPDEHSDAWSEPALHSGIGISVLVGGGATGFTEKDMRNITSNVGGLWDVRLTIGSHVPLGLDISYVGSATSINNLPTGDTGTLIGTAVEGALRWNILPHGLWTPYVFGGVGWQRYDVTGLSAVSRASVGMNKHDNLLEFPMGLGLSYRMNGFLIDVRGVFRYTMDQDLVLKSFPTTLPASHSDFAKMHTWEGSAAIGYEF